VSEADTEHLMAVFGRAAPTYDEVIPFFATFGQLLVEQAAPEPGDRVVDLATGRGASLIPAAQAVAPTGSVLGIDLRPEMVAALAGDLARLGLLDAEVRVGDITALDLADESFDVALCGFTLQVLPDPSAAAAEAYRVLRPGGRLSVSVPRGVDPAWTFLGELARRFATRAKGPIGPIPNPSFDAAPLLTEAGFGSVTAVERAGRFRFRDADQWWAWTWTQGVRALLESLPTGAVEELRQAAFQRLAAMSGPDGIPLEQRALIVTGWRPAGP
jgi:O-methyltransferase/aklanonic acid methyltransferase